MGWLIPIKSIRGQIQKVTSQKEQWLKKYNKIKIYTICESVDTVPGSGIRRLKDTLGKLKKRKYRKNTLVNPTQTPLPVPEPPPT